MVQKLIIETYRFNYGFSKDVFFRERDDVSLDSPTFQFEDDGFSDECKIYPIVDYNFDYFIKAVRDALYVDLPYRRLCPEIEDSYLKVKYVCEKSTKIFYYRLRDYAAENLYKRLCELELEMTGYVSFFDYYKELPPEDNFKALLWCLKDLKNPEEK